MAYDVNKVAKKRGWDMTSCRTGIYNPVFPRHGFRWNDAEDNDLRVGWEQGLRNIKNLAEAHGRSQGGINSRLDLLELSEDDPIYQFAESQPTESVLRQLLGSDFKAYCQSDLIFLDQLPMVPKWPKVRVDLSSIPGLHFHPNFRCVVKPIPTENLENTMNLTTNRLMVLLAIHRGTFVNELTCGTTGPDVASLVNAKLVTQAGTSGYNLSLTAAGTSLVTSVLNYGTGQAGSPSRLEIQKSSDLADGTGIYLVACADSDVTDTRLTKAPRVKHPTEAEANAEAIRLATANEGKEFLVFKAITSHATRSPVVSKRLY